jgi:hypothetical protein
LDAVPFIQGQTADGSVLLNLANVSAINIDENGSFGVRLRVTVHLAGGTVLDFDDEYADRLLRSLEATGVLDVKLAQQQRSAGG